MSTRKHRITGPERNHYVVSHHATGVARTLIACPCALIAISSGCEAPPQAPAGNDGLAAPAVSRQPAPSNGGAVNDPTAAAPRPTIPTPPLAPIPVPPEQGTAVALADPLNLQAYDAIVSILGRPCRRIVCPAPEIEQAISRCYYLNPGEEGSYLTPDGPAGEQHQGADAMDVSSTVQTRAEDLRNILTLPKVQVAPILSRLKITANLNIAEHRPPQDRQSRMSIGQELVDIRVSVIPTAGGERVVLQLLDRGRGELKLEEIGFGPRLHKTLRSLIGISHGIVLITGPTGSGKTTTLYGALNELNCQERIILTVEDPVEYQLRGIGQMQVRPKIDLTFANCLRHILRQDPDIIMIGEIRDREIAEMYDAEVQTSVRTLTSLLEPIILLVMGGVVAFIVMAILLPVFEINQAL